MAEVSNEHAEVSNEHVEVVEEHVEVVEERVRIPLSDGVHLAADLYRPAGQEPQPVVLEALPYRKDDMTGHYAGEYRRLVAEGGYAVARVDLRGTGSSQGLATDEYPAQEQEDLCEVIEWLAGRSWSTGSVGMYGTSYSGFNSIQVAMRRPPALKAICAIYASDDRYTDDVHYEGGARRAMDFVDYVLYMAPMNVLPPVPEVYGEGWREAWIERIERSEPWLLRWLEEQCDGPYWRHGSLRPDYEAIECATMIVAGWADGYRNATFRMFERLTGPKRLLIGPWSHASTESSLPGPHIDLVPEMIRWWDRWLRGRDHGNDGDPPITVFVRRSTVQEPDGAQIRGAWRFEQQWPPARLHKQELSLHDAAAPGRLETEADELAVRGDVGPAASLSCAGALPWGQPWDQRHDDALSLCYDWGPFDEDLEILGYPALELEVSASAPVAFCSVKLSDVFPDGTSSLVSRGLLNLTHRTSSTDPEPLEPGRAYRVTIPLTATSWLFEPGHRVRVAIAGADWPNVWPPPEPVTLRVRRAGARLLLPVLHGPPDDGPTPRLQPPPGARGAPGPTKRVASEEERPVIWRLEHDVLTREARVVIDHGSSYTAENGARVVEDYSGHTAVSTRDPGDARAVGRVRYTMAWPEVTASVEARATLRSDRDAYHLELELDVDEDGVALSRRRWDRTVPRRLQ